MKDDVIENLNTSLFIITPQTIHHNNKTILLRNISNLLKCECVKTSKKIFAISDHMVNYIYKIIFCTSFTLILLNMQASLGARIDQTTIQAIVWFNKTDLFIVSNIIVTILALSLITLLYSFYERNNKSPTIHYFGLLIETKTGQSEGLFIQNKVFIEQLFDHITKALNDQEFVELIANFNTTEIRYINTKTHQISDISLNMVNNSSLVYN